MGFQEILLENGYERFSCEYNRKTKKISYTKVGNMYDFSTMTSGRLDNRWIKNGHEIIFGLNEFGKPPTLIQPRPIGVLTDDEMNKLLYEDAYKVFQDISK